MSAVIFAQTKDAKMPLQIDGFKEGTREADVAVIDKCLAQHGSALLQGERGRIIIEMAQARFNKNGMNDAPIRICFDTWDDGMLALAAASESAKELGDAIAQLDPLKACVASVSTPNISGRRTYVLSLPRSAKNSTAQKLNTKD